MTNLFTALELSFDAPSWTERARAAERLASAYCAGEIQGLARRAAEDLFRALLPDTEPLVRQVLAECLKRAPGLPHDLALGLARDQAAAVAVPILKHSPVLTEDDLIEVLQDAPREQRLAIAERAEGLSPAVSYALCAA